MRRASGLALLLVVACARPPAAGEPVPLGRDSVARFVAVPAGADCAHGGQRLEVGLDADGDGSLSDDEVQSSALVCDGAPGATAAADLLRLVPALLASCAGAGVRVDIGRDLDGDLLLDDEEVRDSGDLCAGAAGARGGDALVELTDASACTDGGQLVRVGLDADEDGALSEGEVLTSRAVCDGADAADSGAAGNDGVATLVEVTAEEVECDAGGQRVRVGRDADGSGALANEEVSESVVLCNGVEGQAGGPGPGSGVSEGSSDAPVPVAVSSSFADLYAAHAGSVAGGGRSYYSFTTRSGPGPMPYTVALLEAETDLVVTVHTGDASGTAVPVRCHDEPHGDAMARICDTDPLATDAPYLVVVRDPRNVANAYLLSVSAGASQGTAVAPVQLDAGGLDDDADLVTRASVRELGVSFYRFAPTVTDHHTITLENIDAPDGEPPLGFELYDGEVRADRLLLSCAQLLCPTPRLSALAPVIVRVTGGAPKAAAFDLRISQGDDVTPTAPLGVVADAAPILQLTTDDAGGYAIFLGFNRFGVADNANDPQPFQRCEAIGSDVCLFQLEGSRRYYLFADDITEGRQVLVHKSNGQEGLPTSPLPLALDTVHAGSTDQERFGDNGSVPAESYYSFTTAAAGMYSLDVTWHQPVTGGGPAMLLYRDALFTEELLTEGVAVQEHGRVYVSEPLAASTTYFLRVRSYDALTFELRVSAGDGGISSLPLDGSLLTTTVPGTDVSWHRFELAEAGPVDVSLSGLDASLTVYLFHESIGAQPFSQWTRSADGTTTIVLPSGTWYLQLLTQSSQEIGLAASLPAQTSLALDTPFTRVGLPPATSDWYRFEATVSGTHGLLVTLDTSGGGYHLSAAELYDADDGARTLSVFGPSTLSYPLLGADPLPAGTWLLRIENQSATLNLDYDVQVSAP